jgi:hypothetical protein
MFFGGHLMSAEALGRAARRAKRQPKLGHDAVCAHCGWSEPSALIRCDDGTVLCYECLQRATGKQPVEAHHHLGRAVDPTTVNVPGNLHRDLSDRQYDWPAEMRRNPTRDPLLWLAAACLGLRDHLAWWVSQLSAISAFLVAASGALQRELGAAWAVGLGLPPITGGIQHGT